MNKENKNVFWSLFILFEVVFFIKAIQALLIDSPLIFPDESCIIQRAMHFIKYFDLASCTEMTTIPVGNPQFLYSLIISPIFLFFEPKEAYNAVLIFNALLMSSLVFPLFHIFKKFISNNRNIFFSIVILLFMTQIYIFEKLLMTEVLFIFLNIWFLYFYLNSFRPNNSWLRNKIIAVLLAILALFTRPFGAIVLLSVAINEIISSKKRKYLIGTILPLVVLSLAYTVFSSEKLDEYVLHKVYALGHVEGWKNLLIAVKTQINSFAIATYFVPLIIFFNYLWKKDSQDLVNIRYYLITFVLLNFLISAQHIFGYLEVDMFDPGLLTRYINVSVIIILLFSFIFYQRYKEFKLNRSNIFLILILLICLIFLNISELKFSLNLDLVMFYNHYLETRNPDMSVSKNILEVLIPIFLVMLFYPLVKNRRSLLISLLSIIIVLHYFSTFLFFSNYTVVSAFTTYFNHGEKKIAYLSNVDDIAVENPLWVLLSTTRAKINYVFVNVPSDIESSDIVLDRKILSDSKFIKEADYILTKYNTDLELQAVINDYNIYKNTDKDFKQDNNELDD